ncbi:CRISPR-associated endonuclease Cas1 [Streptococcus fryi]
MGYEGRSAISYFYYLSLMLPHAFRFKGRSKRPSEDPFNCLLNLGYSLLYSFFIGMIRQNGLSQGFGFLHQPRRHHAVLASDLMEEWRPVIVDDTMVHLIMSGQLVLEHFELSDRSGYTLTSDGLAIVVSELRQRMLEIHAYQKRDSHRYSFAYMADQQIKRLIRAMESLQASDYCDGGDKDEIV